MKFRELVKELKQLGWTWDRANGGHQVFKHPKAIRPIIVPMDNKEKGPKIVQITLKKALKYVEEGIAQKAKQAS
jgi:predicted RNA binding protein YcfA (HicA-like mRNA interferase family)